MSEPSSPSLKDKPRLVISSCYYQEGLTQPTLSHDGRYALTRSGDVTVKLWEVASGLVLWSKISDEIRGLEAAAFAPDFSPENPRLFLYVPRQPGDKPFTFAPAYRIWDIRSDAWEDKLDLTASEWDIASSAGKRGSMMRQSSTAIPRPTDRAEFADEGRSIRVVHGEDAVLWSVTTGPCHEAKPTTASYDPLVQMPSHFDDERKPHDVLGLDWEHSPGARFGLELVQNERSHTWEVNVYYDPTSRHQGVQRYRVQATTVGLSPDARFLVTASLDGITRVWEVETGALVCSLVSFVDETWAIFDPEGRYDASNAGDIDGLYWVVGVERIALSQLKDRYYEPGLLSKLLGWNKDALRKVESFTAPKLFPTVEPFQVEGDTLRLTLTDRGGGFGPVRVAVNGSEVFEIRLDDEQAEPKDGPVRLRVNGKASNGDVSGERTGKVLRLTLKSPRFETSGNQVDVAVFNQEEYLSSRRIRPSNAPDPAATTTPDGPLSLHAIVVGVSHYREDNSLRLHYGAKDARDFARELERAARPLFTSDKNKGAVNIQLLTADFPEDTTATALPTREKVEEAFKKVASEAKLGDVLVVFLAGHGGTFKNEFFYLTCDAKRDTWASTDSVVRKRAAISNGELIEYLRDIKANKRVLILDACEAGAALEGLSSSRRISTDQERALERLNDRMGFHVLAGSPKHAVSLEAGRFEQGLLTYSLLDGLKHMTLREGKFVDVVSLLNYAADKVPDLAKEIRSVQRPVVSSVGTKADRSGAGTGSFDLGQLGLKERAEIVLKAYPSPMVVHSSFQDAELGDVFELGNLVDGVLQSKEPQIEFVEQNQCVGAYVLTGRYVSDESGIEVQMSIRLGKQKVGELVVKKGTTADLPKLAEDLVAELLLRLFKPN